MMDTRNYHIFFYEVFFPAGILCYNPTLVWNHYMFLSGGRGTLLKVNMDNPDEREIKTNYVTNPLKYHHYCIYEDKMVSVDACDDSDRWGEVRVYDLHNDHLLTNFFVTNYVTLPAGVRYSYSMPVVFGSDLLIYVRDDGRQHARMMVLDKDNYSFKEEINLDGSMVLPNLIMKYVRGTKAYYETSYGVYIYDHSQKRCVRHITPQEVMSLAKGGKR